MFITSTHTDCTKSLPKLTDEEIASGLATRLLLELVQRDDSQQKHFTTLLYTLVPETKKDGIDASSLQVTDLLRQKSISSAKLVQRLLRLGMKVTETDVSSAVQILQECHSNVLQLMLKECAKTRKSFFTSACQEAIKAKKFQFIVCLIENGGLPDYEDLKDATGWPQKNVDPVIEQYLLENTQLGEKEDADRSDFQNLFGVPLGPKSPRTDHAPFVVSATCMHVLTYVCMYSTCTVWLWMCICLRLLIFSIYMCTSFLYLRWKLEKHMRKERYCKRQANYF